MTSERRNKYERWLVRSFKKIDEDYFSLDFQPRDESDIKCHLYHALLLTKEDDNLINKNRYRPTTEYSLPGTQKKVDVVLLSGMEPDSQPRLFVEIKETKSGYLPVKEIRKRILSDYKKLENQLKIVNDNVNVGKIPKYVLDWIREPWIYFFFRGAKNGVSVKIDQALFDLNNELNGVELWWGPGCRRFQEYGSTP